MLLILPACRRATTNANLDCVVLLKVLLLVGDLECVLFDLRYFVAHRWIAETHDKSWSEAKDFAFASFLEELK